VTWLSDVDDRLSLLSRASKISEHVRQQLLEFQVNTFVHFALLFRMAVSVAESVYIVSKKVRSFPGLKNPLRSNNLRFCSVSETPAYTARPRTLGSASCGMSVYFPAEAGTHLLASEGWKAKMT